MATKVRVRFAPSPTGYLHVGGARTALFNFLYAKKFGGTYILRIEDTDTERNKAEFEAEILDSMKWLGLAWDEGPFYQSRRLDRYAATAEKLLQTAGAYKCYCTEAEVQQMREQAVAAGKKPMYNRKCRSLTRPPSDNAAFCVRFATPLEGDVVIDDLVKGEVRVSLSEIDDFVILRTGGAPTYNFTVVVDDVDMNITHVIRGEEHLNNTPKQLIIMQALAYPTPRFAHLPLILAPDKSKLSKRHGAVGVTQFRRDGFLPEALLNYLAKLGWSEGDKEIYSLDELKAAFDPKGFGSSGSVFDTTKLDWYNAQYLKLKSPTEIVDLVKASLGADISSLLQSESSRKLLLALRERATRLTDFVTQTGWYRSDTFETDPAARETVLKTANSSALKALSAALAALEDNDFKSERIGPLFKEVATGLGLKMPDLAKPARVLLTGTLASPDIGLVVEALGKARVKKRLEALST